MLGEGGAKNVSPLVSNAPNLEDFRFSTTRVPEAGAAVLGAALGHATKLKRLNLSDNTYGVGGATALAGSLAKMPDMEWLNLCDTGENNSEVLLCASVPLILLSWPAVCAGLTEEGVVLVMKATHGMGSLTSLNLAGNDVTEDAVEPLLECLKCHTKLEELILDDNDLEDSGAQALAELLESGDGDATVLPCLKTLSLCFTEMHSSGAKAIAHAIAKGDSGARSVEEVRLNGNAIGPKGLGELQKVLGDRNGEFGDNEEDASDDDE
jgi:Ran GTPase-activating protein (RanGAP) involved in mRNA processing and transport